MRTVFTDYIRSLEPGVEPDSDLFDRAWEALGRTLRGEIKKRGLWNASPSNLGICGQRHLWDRDALEELLHDCYVFIFVERLRALKKQLKIRDNVDGLIFRNVRNFLHNLQELHDPLGARVFRILRKAVRRLIESGGLRALEGDAKIRSDTCLGFSSHGDCSGTRAAALEEIVPVWCNDLVPELVTAIGRGVAAVLARLQELLSRLRIQGFEAFLFREVLAPLRAEVKRRWQIGTSDETAGFEEDVLVPAVLPEHDFEDREGFRYLVRCVSQGILRVAKTRKTQGHLLAYWRFLVDRARQDPDAKIPPDVGVGKLLGIPRERLPELRSMLGESIDACKSRNSEKVPVIQ